MPDRSSSSRSGWKWLHGTGFGPDAQRRNGALQMGKSTIFEAVRLRQMMQGSERQSVWKYAGRQLGKPLTAFV
jgi:hypothetical protein